MNKQGSIKRILVLVLIAVLGVVGIVWGSNFYIGDYISIDGVKLTKTYDVVVCRTPDKLCDIICTDNDCSDEIEEAINSTGINGGGSIFIRKGNYPIQNPIHIYYSNIIIDSDKATIYALADVGAEAMLWSRDNSNITIKNLIFDANNTARRTVSIGSLTQDTENIFLDGIETKNTITGYIWSGLHISSPENKTVRNVIIRNCYVHDHPETTYDTIVFSRVENLFVDGCTFENIGNNVLVYGGKNVRLMNNKFENSGIVNLQGKNIVFSNNNLNGTYVFIRPFDAEGASDQSNTENILISLNTIYNGGIDIAHQTNQVKKVTVVNNYIEFDPIRTGDSSNGIVLVDIDKDDSIRLIGNFIRGAGRSGIYLANCSNVDIISNWLEDNGGNTALSVRGNLIDFSSLNPSYNISVIDNTFNGKDITVNVHLYLRGDYNRIITNKFLGTATTKMNLGGSNNVIVANFGYSTSKIDTSLYLNNNPLYDVGDLFLNKGANPALVYQEGGVEKAKLQRAGGNTALTLYNSGGYGIALAISSGNVVLQSGDKVCLDGSTCAAYIYYNGSCIVSSNGGCI